MHVGHWREPRNYAAAIWGIQSGEQGKFCMCSLERLLAPSWTSGNLLSGQVLEPSAWATMLAVIWLHANGKELKCEWSLLERKAVVWLHNNAGRSTAPTPFLSPFKPATVSPGLAESEPRGPACTSPMLTGSFSTSLTCPSVVEYGWNVSLGVDRDEYRGKGHRWGDRKDRV